jgi:hypothetical protein
MFFYCQVSTMISPLVFVTSHLIFFLSKNARFMILKKAPHSDAPAALTSASFHAWNMPWPSRLAGTLARRGFNWQNATAKSG